MPLFYGTCPTITPVLTHARELVLPLLGSMKRSHRRSDAAFAEDEVLKAQSVAWWDTAVLAWMAESLPTGQDIDVTLDALGVLDATHLASLEHRFGSTMNRMRSLARQRIAPLIFAQTAVPNGAAVARALETCLSLNAYAPWTWRDMFALNVPPSTRTHDVFFLTGALKLEISASDPSLHKDEIRSEGIAVLEPLSAWSLQQEFGRQEPDIMLQRTRESLLHAAERWLELIADDLTISDWIRLILAFRDMPDPCRRLHVRLCAAPVMRHLLENTLMTGDTNRVLILQDGWFESLRIWTILYARRDLFNMPLLGEQYPIPRQHAIWSCYLSALKSYRSMRSPPVLPLVHAYTLLAPFEYPLGGWLQAVPRDVIQVASLLLFAQNRTSIAEGGWSTSLASLTFNLLQAMISQSIPPGTELVTFIALIVSPTTPLSSSGSHHALPIPTGPLESSILTLDDTALNLLLPRISDDGLSTSVWQLAMALIQTLATNSPDAWYFTRLGTSAADLSAGLSMAMQLGYDVTDMAEQLLVDSSSFAVRLLTGSTSIDAFELARHARIFAPAWWENAKTGVLTTDLRKGLLAGYSTAEAFVEAVDRAGPCERCTHTVKQARETSEVPEFRNTGSGPI